MTVTTFFALSLLLCKETFSDDCTSCDNNLDSCNAGKSSCTTNMNLCNTYLELAKNQLSMVAETSLTSIFTPGYSPLVQMFTYTAVTPIGKVNQINCYNLLNIQISAATLGPQNCNSVSQVCSCIDVTQYLQNLGCENQSYCASIVTVDNFGGVNPCPDSPIFLTVTYQCGD